jgi:hypothetical protein
MVGRMEDWFLYIKQNQGEVQSNADLWAGFAELHQQVGVDNIMNVEGKNN